MSAARAELRRLFPPGTRVEVLGEGGEPSGPSPDALLAEVGTPEQLPEQLITEADRRAGPGTLLIAVAGRGPAGLRAITAFEAALRGSGWTLVERRALVPGPGPTTGPRALAWVGARPYLAARRALPRPGLSVSVIVPCHDEEGNLAECVSRIPPLGPRTEVILCDDGSRDATRVRALELAAIDRRVRVLAVDQNQGKAAAVRAGFASATGDVVVILDADMTVPPEDLPRFVAPLVEGQADFVNGTRFRRPMEAGAMPAANRLGNRAFAAVVRALLAQPLTDTLCGTKAALRSQYLRMPFEAHERWGDFDLLFGAGGLRQRIAEVDVSYGQRRAGESKMRPARETLRFAAACLRGWRLIRGPLENAPQPPPELGAGWREIRP